MKKIFLALTLMSAPFASEASIRYTCTPLSVKEVREQADVYLIRKPSKPVDVKCTCATPFLVSCMATIDPEHIESLEKNTTINTSFTYNYTGDLDTSCDKHMVKAYKVHANSANHNKEVYLKKTSAGYFTRLHPQTCE